MYKSPGGLDEFNRDLLEIWNKKINEVITKLRNDEKFITSDFFKANHDGVTNGEVLDTVSWSAAPKEPERCFGRSWARKLSNWGVKGRHKIQNEYCEYGMITAMDNQNRLRPKRVVFTTELSEYWVLLAEFDPNKLMEVSTKVLGFEPSWNDLYDTSDPFALEERVRRVRFCRLAAGHGNHKNLVRSLVPREPIGRINTEHVLFMSHMINGLDDLIYILMLGAVPFGVEENGGSRRAEVHEIFQNVKTQGRDMEDEIKLTELICRNADPQVVKQCYDIVMDSREVAFSEHLGVYIRPLNQNLFLFEGNTIPPEWIRYCRGEEGMYQRLEFGPGDDDDAFLDDIKVADREDPLPITGGYEVARQLEVGPLVVQGSPIVSNQSDGFLIKESPDANCTQTERCKQIAVIKAKYEAEQPNNEGDNGG